LKKTQILTLIGKNLFIRFFVTDAGKSTIGGQIMFLTGMVDKRTLEKYEREAKEKNRETWYLSWCMDTNQEGKF
jgi:translation elongation factor EF-1alpha